MAKIFMAEDDPLMIRMYERAFKASGFELETAFDGEEALAKLEKMDPLPTLLLLDVMMPKKNGFDVLKAVKQNEKLKHIPAIMLTNLAGQTDAENAMTLGAVLYLVKSEHDPREILEKVKEVLAASDRGGNVPRVVV
ncbi:MAG: response regulator [bacterium]|nr:response regulator [bacterium]